MTTLTDASDDYSEESGLAERLADESCRCSSSSGHRTSSWTPSRRRATAAVPGARVVVLDGVGHSPHVERPAATARLIADFLAQQAER